MLKYRNRKMTSRQKFKQYKTEFALELNQPIPSLFNSRIQVTQPDICWRVDSVHTWDCQYLEMRLRETDWIKDSLRVQVEAKIMRNISLGNQETSPRWPEIATEQKQGETQTYFHNKTNNKAVIKIHICHIVLFVKFQAMLLLIHNNPSLIGV